MINVKNIVFNVSHFDRTTITFWYPTDHKSASVEIKGWYRINGLPLFEQKRTQFTNEYTQVYVNVKQTQVIILQSIIAICCFFSHPFQNCHWQGYEIFESFDDYIYICILDFYLGNHRVCYLAYCSFKSVHSNLLCCVCLVVCCSI